MDDSREEVPEAVAAWLAAGPGSRADVSDSLREWLARGPENQRALEDFANVWKLSQTPPSKDGWPALRSRIDGARVTPLRPTPATFRRNATIGYFAAAAVVLGLAVSVSWSRFRAAGAPLPQPTIVSVPAAAMSTVELEGGVVVRLNSVSSISYTPSRGAIQEVRLDGEAYFEVPHNPSRTFRVVTEMGVITDVGTQFNVTARSGKVAVTVVDGAAELEAAGAKVSLRAGETSYAMKGAQPAKPESANLATALSWTRGRLVFSDETLDNVAEALTRRFGVPFTVSEELKSTRLRAAMTARTSRDAAAAVCAAVSAHCEQAGAGWYISRASRR